MIPAGHPLLGRVIADQATDPAGWTAARSTHIGASDAAKYAKLASVESYVRTKLHNPFTGNAFTANGHLFEPAIVGFMRVSHNTRMFEHPTIPEFSCTPDALDVLDDGTIVNGEAKVKHKPITGPTPMELRQVAFSQFVLDTPYTWWGWLELDEMERPVREPTIIRLDRHDLADVIGPVLEIAHHVADAMRAAAVIKRETTTR